jgi:Putative transmembrane protein (PGPGW)
MSSRYSVKRLMAAVAGAVLVLAGTALLVLPGPGLLLVLAGLILLSSVFPALERHVGPVRAKALRATEESVSSPLRVTGSVLVGLVLVGAGVVWGLVRDLPFSGWATGASLILSGAVLLALLAYSYQRVRRRGDEDHPHP